MKEKVLLGMSGGVDSSVSAILLQEQGYEVVGATMRLWEGKEEICGSSSNVNDAKIVCKKLGIEHHVLDLKEEFKTCVINDFINAYKNAKTPNPCIECNKHLKFGYFYKKAQELGCKYIATGHYAKTEYSEKYNQVVLKKSNSSKKDQSYVLYNIPRNMIENVLFPLADFENKEQIRHIAEEHGLTVASKPDSQEICFIPDNNYGKFLEENLEYKPKAGNIVDENGRVLGKHRGLIYYTIGQRKGLGISSPTPLYVIKLDKIKNEVVVGKEEKIYSKELFADSINFTVFDKLEKELKVKAKVRYLANEANATIYPCDENTLRVEFEEPQRAITPGQSVVFYDDDILIGGGKIIR